MSMSPLDFLGIWAIKRVIEDAKSCGAGRFQGEAVIFRKDEDWLYAERGILEIPNSTPMQAERKYIWKPDETGFDIFFEDKRFFHRFDLGDTSEARHWCDPDQYEVNYDLKNWPQWQSIWRVKGPRKNYVMRSSFSPKE